MDQAVLMMTDITLLMIDKALERRRATARSVGHDEC